MTRAGEKLYGDFPRALEEDHRGRLLLKGFARLVSGAALVATFGSKCQPP